MMKKNFTALLAVAVIITESSIPASAIAKTPALEALGYARVDGCGLFGENVDLYVQTKHPGSTAMMFNVTWTTDGKLLPTKTIGFTLKEYNAEVRETLEPLIEEYLHPIKESRSGFEHEWEQNDGSILYEVYDIPENADIDRFREALVAQDLISTYYGPGEIFHQWELLFGDTPTDYNYWNPNLSKTENDKQKMILKAELEKYVQEHFPDYEVILTNQREGLEIIRIKPIAEPIEGLADWELSVEKYAERIAVSAQIYKDFDMKPYWMSPMDISSPLLAKSDSEIRGNVDGDSEVTMKDAMKVLREWDDVQNLFLPGTFTEEQKLRADVNGDGNIDMKDAMFILKYASEVSDGYEPTWDEILGK